MASRLKLHDELVKILGSNNVYFQPPSSGLKYPCIKYSVSGADIKHANNGKHTIMKRYELILIDLNPDSVFFDPILDHFQYCSFDRAYPADGLNHFVFSIYY